MLLVSHSIRLIALAWCAASVTALSLRGDARSVQLNAARTAGALPSRADSDSLVNAYEGECQCRRRSGE